MPLPRRVNKQQKQRFVVGPIQDRVLHAMLRYHYLSSRQVCRLFYHPGSLTYVQTNLKLMTDLGYLQRLFLPRTNQHGSAPSVYTLARKGLNYLKSQDLDEDVRYRPCEQREHSYLFLSHTLAVNDMLIGLELFCQSFPQLTIETMLHERVLKRDPIRIEDTDGKKVAVIPDAWFDLRLDGSQQMCLALELDQGTVEQKKWRCKVRGLVQYSRGPYQERYNTESLTVAVVATPGEKRLSDLLRWTEAELQELGKDEADLFRFAHFSPRDTDPAEMFLSPSWYRPFDDDALPLLDGLK